VRATDAFPDHMINKWIKSGSAEMQGRRPTMEDTLIIDAHFRKNANEHEDEAIVAVYDGHGGKEAADYIKDELHIFFKRKLEQYNNLIQLKQKLEDRYTLGTHGHCDEEDMIREICTLSENLIPHVTRLLLHKNNRNTVKMKKVLQQESVQQILRNKQDSDDSDDDSDSDDDNSSTSSTSSREHKEKKRKQRKKECDLKESSVEPIEFYNLTDIQAIPLLLRDTFLETNEVLCEKRIKNGATASVVYLRTVPSNDSKPTRQCFVANVGDSRVVLCREGKAIRLTIDHRPNDIDEIRRVKDAGGTIVNNRVNAILAITRAIGDVYLHPMVTSDPYTTVVDLMYEKDQFLIVACDGVWDVVSDQDAIDHVKDEPDPRIAAMKLRDLAYSRNSTDNISVIVVRITNHDIVKIQ
jgi:serine/threonine protein phosphatase PrpC